MSVLTIFCLMVIIKCKPLSVNKAYLGRKFKTKEHRQYAKDVYNQLPDIKLPAFPLSIYYEFGLSSKRSDLDNCIKIFQDVLQSRYSFDDCKIYHFVAVKVDVAKGFEYIKFDIQHFE